MWEAVIKDTAYKGESMIWGSWGNIIQYCGGGHHRELSPALRRPRGKCSYMNPGRVPAWWLSLFQAIEGARTQRCSLYSQIPWHKAGRELQSWSGGAGGRRTAQHLYNCSWVHFPAPFSKFHFVVLCIRSYSCLPNMFILVLRDTFFSPRAYHSSITSHGLENQILFLNTIYIASCSHLFSSLLFQNYRPQLKEEMRKPDIPFEIWVDFSISFRKEQTLPTPLLAWCPGQDSHTCQSLHIL